MLSSKPFTLFLCACVLTMQWHFPKTDSSSKKHLMSSNWVRQTYLLFSYPQTLIVIPLYSLSCWWFTLTANTRVLCVSHSFHADDFDSIPSNLGHIFCRFQSTWPNVIRRNRFDVQDRRASASPSNICAMVPPTVETRTMKIRDFVRQVSKKDFNFLKIFLIFL